MSWLIWFGHDFIPFVPMLPLLSTAKVVDWVILEPKKPRYWKGFSRGLKETRKTVADSEEGLPSVQLGPTYKTWPDIVSDQHDRLWHP